MNTHQTIRWGVIGSGGIARRRTIPEGIMPAKNSELVAVFDVQEALNREVAQQFGAHACTDEAQLLARDDIDAVYLATPALLHHRQVLQVAEAQKHVFCEKPLGLNTQKAQEMIDACDRAGVTLGVGFMARYHAMHQQALALVQQGKLGTLTYGRAQLSCWFPPMEGNWRQDPAKGGGGSLIDLGGHCIDLLEMYFGPAQSVFCQTANIVHPYASEDSATVLLEFASGAQATVDAFFCIPDACSKNRLELYGSSGSILAEGTIGQSPNGTMTAFIESTDQSYQAQQARSDSESQAICPTPVNMYQAEIEDFSAALLEKRPFACDGQLGLQSTKVIDACYESARTHKKIRLADVA